jgi:hypothetical protein
MARFSVLHQFYRSKEWQAFRVAIIAERGMVCQHCGKLIAGIGELTLHHIIELTPENIHDADVALNPDNVLVIHHDCHDQIHGRFGYQPKKAVYIVYGMPCSGKSTYVAQMMRRGDLIVDMDRLYEAVTGLLAYDKPDALLPNVRALHNLLLDQIRTRYGKWFNAWVIGGFPDKYQREKLADELGAELIYCECTREEAIARLEMDERRRLIKAEYIGYIDAWLERYQE